MFPGATVKEELHLIFRLMGLVQRFNLPQTPEKGGGTLVGTFLQTAWTVTRLL